MRMCRAQHLKQDVFVKHERPRNGHLCLKNVTLTMALILTDDFGFSSQEKARNIRGLSLTIQMLWTMLKIFEHCNLDIDLDRRH